MKRYEDLDITDNFMFSKVFSNEDVAKDFLQDILKISIEKIEVVTEASAQEDPFHKSVRFDVLVREESFSELKSVRNLPGVGRYFDIELQMDDTGELPKRARYYQGMCDLDALGKGANYEELQEQYILFLCPKDIFGKGKPIYRFQNREESDPKILMGDLCYKNYYIFRKFDEIKDASIREYMRYFATQEHRSEKMERIHRLVERYRQDPVTRKAYMTLEQELDIRYKRGLEKGLERGRSEGVAEGRADERKELAKAFRDDGVPIELISKRTGLSPEEIRAL
ncbi:Rpn family recombination-promoting nuclease/putative transposase [Fibrobacter sp. UWS1]|uniref:Rpn family recombination-promoting nuclease/putative transposase n=1 Tax=Fibrobacter sp. UWS1 TaxID=1896220 RepID=UPI000BB0E94E|nr:Rpn family recombination-promoting nuclease/putative transposase [Fibrobacter sp. UWS1]PBC68360.1 putative transposase/invertase (TIGR01784 family) [Fibrobacter sp. UWS1]